MRTIVYVVGLVGAALLAGTLFWLIQSNRASERELRQLGERLYTEQSCVVCHGPRGRGDGPKAHALNPAPRDFRSLDAYVQGTAVQDVAETLRKGVVVHPSQMPSFSHLTERERLALGEFIVSLQRGGLALDGR